MGRVPGLLSPVQRLRTLRVAAGITALALLVTLQATALWRFPIAGVKPDLVLVTVAVWSARRGVREGTITGFLAGLLLELYSGAPFGTTTTAMTVVGFCTAVGETNLLKSNLLLPGVLVPAATLLYDVLFLFLLASQQFPVDWLATLQLVVLPSMLVNLAVMPAVYYAVTRYERLLRPPLDLGV